MAGNDRLRVAVTSIADPTSRRTWSGVPYGVLRGLQALGVEAVPVQVAPPTTVGNAACRVIAATSTDPAIRRDRPLARETVRYSHLYTRQASRRLRRIGPIDAVVQMGLGYEVHHPQVMTFEDMTIAQAVTHKFGFWADLNSATVAHRRDQQRRNYHRVRACGALTQWAADSIIEDYGVDSERVHVVGGGANIEPQTTPPGPEDDKWHHPMFLFVGGDWKRKNGPVILQAFARVREEFPSAELHLVGGHPPVTAPGVTDHGLLPLGDPQAQTRLKDLMMRATCLLLPSAVEPGGLIHLDAASFGVASIGTTVGGAIDMVGDAGYLVPPGDVDALVERMRLMTDPAHAARMGHRAHQRSLHHRWVDVARRILQVFNLPTEPPHPPATG